MYLPSIYSDLNKKHKQKGLKDGTQYPDSWHLFPILNCDRVDV
ncbi:hypothetical protein VCHA50O407_40116 [Vibrio chagasii]|nr:hypothetical protein VCHA50O407_40116 [Vibrio chagasii]